jgi:hypothetical protein
MPQHSRALLEVIVDHSNDKEFGIGGLQIAGFIGHLHIYNANDFVICKISKPFSVYKGAINEPNRMFNVLYNRPKDES